VKLAARGQRDMDAGPESIDNATELSLLRSQARGIHFKSLLAAGMLTLLLLLL
jgi:hypothetical protein